MNGHASDDEGEPAPKRRKQNEYRRKFHKVNKSQRAPEDLFSPTNVVWRQVRHVLNNTAKPKLLCHDVKRDHGKPTFGDYRISREALEFASEFAEQYTVELVRRAVCSEMQTMYANDPLHVREHLKRARNPKETDVKTLTYDMLRKVVTQDSFASSAMFDKEILLGTDAGGESADDEMLLEQTRPSGNTALIRNKPPTYDEQMNTIRESHNRRFLKNK